MAALTHVRAAGHTAFPVDLLTAVVGRLAVRAAVADGSVRVRGGWAALAGDDDDEQRLAAALLALAAQERLALLWGPVPDGAAVHAVAAAQPAAAVSAALADLPPGEPVVVHGDPDGLPPACPGDVLGGITAWGGVPVRDSRDSTSVLGAFAAAVAAGDVPAPPPDQHALVGLACPDDEAVAVRVAQLVAVSIPRAVGVPAEGVLVVTPLRAGTVGADSLAARGLRACTVHDVGTQRAAAVVLALPAEAAGVVDRRLVYSAVRAADQHLSIVVAEGTALRSAVARRPPARCTGLAGALRDARGP